MIKCSSLIEEFVLMLQLLRFKQFVKNFLIFAPLFFANDFFNVNKLKALFVAFVGFSFIAGSIYILNDINDKNLDKLHPVKSKRPLASEKISVKKALIISFISFLLGIFLLKNVFVLVAIYLVLNILYIYKLKKYSLIDIIIISMGYLIRLFIGSFVSGVFLSHWIIIMTFLLSLFLAISKRYDDLKYKNLKVRENLSGYNTTFIETIMAILASVIIVAYILYTISLEVVQHYQCDYVYTTSLFVLIGLVRYMQLVLVYKNACSPTNIIYNDAVLKITVMLWIVSYLCIIYL